VPSAGRSRLFLQDLLNVPKKIHETVIANYTKTLPRCNGEKQDFVIPLTTFTSGGNLV
jgi:hypothetical protein